MQAKNIDSNHFAERCVEGRIFVKSCIPWTVHEEGLFQHVTFVTYSYNKTKEMH